MTADRDHGSRFQYRERACRCDICREGNAARMRAYAAVVKARDGVSITQKARPPRDLLQPGACTDCGAATRSNRSATPRCAPCWRRAKRSIYISPAVRLSIYERDQWICQLCFEAVDRNAPAGDRMVATLDHIQPRARGGSDDPVNLRLAHHWCNSVRGVGLVAAN